MFQSKDEVSRALAEQRYIATDEIATTLFLAERLYKPVLVEGPAGVGKTELGKAWAAATRRELIRLQCYEGLDETKALYEWEYAKQLLYTQLLRDKLHDLLAGANTLAEAADHLAREEDVFFSERFLLPRPLLRAIRSERPVVLLIDEVDRCVAEGTLIMTPDGPVPVEKLQPGDSLIGFDPATFSRTTVTLQKVHCQQAATILQIIVGGRLLLVTPEHRFVRFTEDGQHQVVQACTLRVGDLLPLDRANRQLSLGRIISTTVVEELTRVYDLTVSGPAYFVANGIVTHNSDTEFEAFLLEVLSDFQVSVPELGTLRAKHMPLVVLTSNNTRELSEALKRRCLYLYLDYPSLEAELRIVRLKVPDLAPQVARQAVEMVHRLRQLDLKKHPSISETLDWAHALVMLNASHIDPVTLNNTLTILLKHEHDILRARQALSGPDIPRRGMDGFERPPRRRGTRDGGWGDEG